MDQRRPDYPKHPAKASLRGSHTILWLPESLQSEATFPDRCLLPLRIRSFQKTAQALPLSHQGARQAQKTSHGETTVHWRLHRCTKPTRRLLDTRRCQPRPYPPISSSGAMRENSPKLPYQMMPRRTSQSENRGAIEQEQYRTSNGPQKHISYSLLGICWNTPARDHLIDSPRKFFE